MDEPLKQGSPIEKSIGTGRDEPGKEKSKAWEQAKKEMEGEGRAGEMTKLERSEGKESS